MHNKIKREEKFKNRVVKYNSLPRDSRQAVFVISQNLYPQSLHSNCFPILDDPNPQTVTDKPLSKLPIFLRLVEPQVGQRGVF